MKLVLLNIRDFAKKQPMFFVMVLAGALISSLLMLFAFGVYQNYHEGKREYIEMQLYMHAYFYETDPETNLVVDYGVTKAEVEQFITQISPETHEAMEVTTMLLLAPKIIEAKHGDSLEYKVRSRFTYKDGVYYPYEKSFESMVLAGEEFSGFYYTVDQYNSGEKIVWATGIEVDDDGKWHYAGWSNINKVDRKKERTK